MPLSCCWAILELLDQEMNLRLSRDFQGCRSAVRQRTLRIKYGCHWHQRKHSAIRPARSAPGNCWNNRRPGIGWSSNQAHQAEIGRRSGRCITHSAWPFGKASRGYPCHVPEWDVQHAGAVRGPVLNEGAGSPLPCCRISTSLLLHRKLNIEGDLPAGESTPYPARIPIKVQFCVWSPEHSQLSIGDVYPLQCCPTLLGAVSSCGRRHL